MGWLGGCGVDIDLLTIGAVTNYAHRKNMTGTSLFADDICHLRRAHRCLPIIPYSTRTPPSISGQAAILLTIRALLLYRLSFTPLHV